MFTFLTLILLLIVWLLGRVIIQNWPTTKGHSKVHIKKEYRPIVMIVIDSLMSQPLEQAIYSKRAPALAFLKKHGQYYPEFVSSFPTMSVCIDSTLLTGTLPNEHHIYGLCYYQPHTKEWINLGTGAKECFAIGLRHVLTNSLLRLNQQLINPALSTIHEAASVPTASIGAFVYRGKKRHQLRVPGLLRWLRILPATIDTMGPKLFSFGAMHKLGHSSHADQPWLRYGENDRFSTDELLTLLHNDQIPPFTLVYYPTNDDFLHQGGVEILQGIELADRQLQRLFNTFSSWEEAINQITWVVLGDSGQTNTLANHKEAFIDLEHLLPYRMMSSKQGRPTSRDQLVLSVNERMSYINILDPTLTLEEVAQKLQVFPYFDLIAWWDEERYHVISGKLPGKFSFSPAGPYVDSYGQTWQISGESQILDLQIRENTIHYNQYPDAMQRLMGVREKGVSKLVLTVMPGYEMIYQNSPRHRGASHGSLHFQDSLVPLIITGTKSRPKHLRMVDLKDWVLKMLSEQR